MQEKFFGQDKEPEEVRTLIGTIQEHNNQCRALVGKDYALITIRRYESCKRYLVELIRQKYGKEDLPLTEVNGDWYVPLSSISKRRNPASRTPLSVT